MSGHWRRWPIALAIGLTALLCAEGLAAQMTDTASYALFGRAIPLVVYLDSIAVHAPGVADPDSIVSAGDGLGFVSARNLGRGIFVVGLAGSQSRRELVNLARQAEALPSIRAAGLAVRPPRGPDPVIVTDRFIVEFRSGIPRAAVDSFNAVNGVEVVRPLGLLENDYLLRVTPAAPLDALDMANRYHQHPMVAFATPNFFARKQETWVPDDGLFADQWHLNNPANDADVDAPEAWDKSIGAPSVVIAVTEVFGFDVTNRDIKDNLFHAWKFYGCVETDSFDVTSPCGSATFSAEGRHGTAVAGLAAGRGDNGEGISGVCPRCRLMLIELPMDDAATALAFQYIADKGASIINNSWAGGITSQYTAAKLDQLALSGRGGLGIVVVWSMRDRNDDQCTGNSADLTQIPSGIAVGASNNLDKRGDPSGIGDCLDLLAPGYAVKSGTTSTNLTGITTADQTGVEGYNDSNTDPTPCAFSEPSSGVNPRDYTRCFAGTSAAAPIVSGVAGLVLSLQPCLKRSQVQEILNATADPIDAAAAGYDAVTGHSNTHGHGRVNAASAVEAADGATCTTQAPFVVQDDQDPPVEPEPPALELGTRFGFTRVWGGVDRSVANIPGSGPLSEPVVYAAWAVTPTVALQFQLGGAVRTGGPDPAEKIFVAAAQPEAVFGAVYGGANIAMRVLAVGGGPTTTDFGAGLAVGYRMLPLSFLALRLEGRYRRWFTTPAIDEIGLALAVGVVIN